MKVLTIKVKNLKDLFDLAKSNTGINEQEAIFYDSIDAFSKSLSHQKIHILTIIKNKKPESISELVRHSPTILLGLKLNNNLQEAQFPSVSFSCESIRSPS